ncbi:tannase [Abiotrophia defectiva]|uniref:tannase n=1 Tax=Abiotrophia defectiva TaxID=46125 RepID=UPI00227EF333|nr:tannase [Abiotrophia defectiva]MCY7225654.1 tannase [Abiotrophia defectiva]
MTLSRKLKLSALTLLCANLLASQVPVLAQEANNQEASSQERTAVGQYSLIFDNAAWQYDEINDIYWQVGVVYVSNPASLDYETLGIYVPGAYLEASANGDGTYTASVKSDAQVGQFTAATAPYVLPVNTPGYNASQAPTWLADGIANYTQAGMIYLQPGIRGRDNTTDSQGQEVVGGAPWGVTDLKAAIRYVRYNKDVLPGDTDKIVSFGHSGGGAQSAVLGASGDSTLYNPYLEALGAAMKDKEGNPISDAPYGTMTWSPITSLDYADAAYEWNLGQFADSNTRAEGTFTQALSQDLAKEYANYINQLGLKHEGQALTLTESSEGIYTQGSYATYLEGVVNQSLNNFLADTSFPYTSDGAGPGGTTESVTYETAQAYIDSLNAETQWVTYDAAANRAKISSLADFAKYVKTASKSVPAFDALDRSLAENAVFGVADANELHFDQLVARLLKNNQAKYESLTDWNSQYVTDFESDLAKTDSLGKTIAERQDLYNPMFYLTSAYSGYQTSKPAPHWRIRSGLSQGDTALTVETNLALALENQANGTVKSVDFATVWGQGNTTAERTGHASANFIQWVQEIVAQDAN